MTTRREVVRQGAALFGLAAASPVAAAAGAAESPDQTVAALLDRQAKALLRDSPEMATRLGFDTGPEAFLRSRLDDRSADAMTARGARAAAAAAALGSIDRTGLSAQAALDLD
ncbi:MAG TPA: DUF885 domain-containing protein, partial [Caulobacter sp.]|nr:DUF885 domain-containing protein [Caulobacter sp.]